ncbi:hypothetical protein [Micromonospora sp. MA102]|uniref:hypothetical protein n=1 Tax=Micromonospora sp. MA102 TaxID=2952755 RepID=UPI0021C77332|nr:hypothetical protein [Micromonospora sp. MA102]
MLAEVSGCCAGRFGRVEPRRAAGEFVTGLLSDLEVKTCSQREPPGAVDPAHGTAWSDFD